MKHITPKIKQLIFALYWGQKVCRAVYPHEGEHIDKVGQWNIHHITNLELLPLSSITDEDAIEVAKLVTGNQDWNGHAHYTARGISVTLVKPNTTVNMVINISNGDASIWDSRLICLDTLPGYDYLRSKGYALPAYGFSVDELVEAGVFKLKEVNND